jgi:WD40 repeat protein
MQIAAVATAADASWAISVDASGTVQTWGTGTPARVIHWAVPIDGSQPTAVAQAGGRVRILWADGKTIRLNENGPGIRPRDAQLELPAAVQALAMSPSGVLAAVACADGTLRTLNAGTGAFGPELATGGRTAQAVAVASDIGPVVAVFPDGSVRRYDPASGTSDMMGAGPGIDLVAVTPDGETVIAAKADGVLSRLEFSRTGAPGDSPSATGRFRLLGTAITAIAVDGTGRRVLASRTDGTLWLYDMTGGQATELRVPESSPESDPPDQRWWESVDIAPDRAPVPPAAPPDPAGDDTVIWSRPAPPPAPPPVPPPVPRRAPGAEDRRGRWRWPHWRHVR